MISFFAIISIDANTIWKGTYLKSWLRMCVKCAFWNDISYIRRKTRKDHQSCIEFKKFTRSSNELNDFQLKFKVPLPLLHEREERKELWTWVESWSVETSLELFELYTALAKYRVFVLICPSMSLIVSFWIHILCILMEKTCIFVKQRFLWEKNLREKLI